MSKAPKLELSEKSLTIIERSTSDAANRAVERFTGALPDILKPQFDKVTRDFNDFKDDVGRVLRTDFNSKADLTKRIDREAWHEESYGNYKEGKNIIRRTFIEKATIGFLGLIVAGLVYIGIIHK